MTAVERLAVHFVAEQRLRLQQAFHVKRFVVIIGALHFHKARGGVGAHQLEEIAHPSAAEVADNVPAFDADVACVLHNFGKRLNRCELVLARLLRQAFDIQRPALKIDFGIDHVVAVVGKFFERHHLRVFEGWSQPFLAEIFLRRPVAEGNAFAQQRPAPFLR